jgi:ubiquinone/menaquinone biosynthesis C-methylase UbiE
MSKPPSPLASPGPWDLVADGYANEAPWVMGPFSERAATLIPIGPESRVVDVAAGPGTLSLKLAPRVKHVTALDFSASMLERLRRGAAGQKLDNIETLEGDGQALPFPDATFDAGFSLFGLMFFPERARGFRELFRVLKPGASAVVSSWAPVERSPLMQVMFGALCAADSTRAAPAYDPTTLENPELFAEEMSAAGFVDVRIEPCELTLPPVGAAKLWDVMVRSSAPIVLLRNRLGEAEWSVQSKKAEAFVDAFFEGGERSLSTTAFFGVGRRAA